MKEYLCTVKWKDWEDAVIEYFNALPLPDGKGPRRASVRAICVLTETRTRHFPNAKYRLAFQFHDDSFTASSYQHNTWFGKKLPKCQHVLYYSCVCVCCKTFIMATAQIWILKMGNKNWPTARTLGSWFRIPLMAWMYVRACMWDVVLFREKPSRGRSPIQGVLWNV
jgi:hypothetical protein